MTIQGALRVLGAANGRPAPDSDRRVYKWDIQANTQLQTAVDLMCLSQLCQALVFHERVATTIEFARSWIASNDSGDVLDEIINFVEIGEMDRHVLQSSAAVDAAALAATEEFRQAVSVLTDDTLVRGFLEISNKYFETGYSDPGIFSDLQTNQDYVGQARNLTRESARLMRLVEHNRQQQFEAIRSLHDEAAQGGPGAADVIERRQQVLEEPARFTEALIGPSDVLDHADLLGRCADNFLKAEELLRRYDRPQDGYPLEVLNLAQEVAHELAGASTDIVRNVAATLFYDRVAGRNGGATYLPHPMRAPLSLVAEALLGGRSSRPPEEAVLRRLEYLRATRATELNRLVALEVGMTQGVYVDTVFPFVLALVLDESSSPDDVIRQTLELRDTRAAQRVRRWFATFSEQLESDDITLEGIEARLGELRSMMTSLEHAPANGGSRKITIGLNIAFASLSKELDLRTRRRSKKQLRLIQDLTRISNASPQLGPALERIFGRATADAWTATQALLSPLRSAHGRCALDLRS